MEHDKSYLLMIPEIFEWVLNLPLLYRPIYVYTSVHTETHVWNVAFFFCYLGTNY